MPSRRSESAGVDSDLPRLVLDTNVFVSGLISPSGSPVRILRAIQNRKIIHLVSDPIVDEYLRVLDYPRIRKFNQVTDGFIADIAASLVYRTERVELFSIFDYSPDPNDNVFLATAVDGKAVMLVTGDKGDLLSLKAVQGIPIVSASEAVARLKI
jgi:putative PIN family toxin of toxin-antitoxin system